MAALDFPASPTNGQLYPAAPNAQYIYNATAGGPSVGAWESLPMQSAKTVTADVPPLNPVDGDQWFNTLDGTLYVYVVDVDGGQWVESQAPITANGYYSPNYIINGDFSINQRGFTSATASGIYGFDRWNMYSTSSGGTGTVTYSAQTFTPGAAPVGGYEGTNYARIVTSGQTVSSEFSQLGQSIEDVRTLAGQTITVSFWAKAASGTPKVGITMAQVSPSTEVLTIAGSVTVSTSWARYSKTITLPSLAGRTLGTGSNLRLMLFTSLGSAYASTHGDIGLQNATIDFWGVQVESGSIATPFRRNANSIQGELAACQRYYYKINDTFISNARSSIDLYQQTFKHPVVMRAIPTVPPGATYRVTTGNAGSPSVGGGTGETSIHAIYFYNGLNNWTSNAEVFVTAEISAEL